MLVVQGVVMSDLAAAADIVLPGAASAEKDAIYTNDQGKVQGASRAITRLERPRGLADSRDTRTAAGSVSSLHDGRRGPPGNRGTVARRVCRRRTDGFRAPGTRAQLAPGVQSFRALEVGFPLSRRATREGSQRSDGKGEPAGPLYSAQTGRLAVRGLVAVVALLLVALQVAAAQLRGIQAELTPIVESDAVAGGSQVRAALQVRLPDRFHVQSDAPRDPNLIPTVLTIDPPDGITVAEQSCSPRPQISHKWVRPSHWPCSNRNSP